jgi:hypothetical protein
LFRIKDYGRVGSFCLKRGDGKTNNLPSQTTGATLN